MRTEVSLKCIELWSLKYKTTLISQSVQVADFGMSMNAGLGSHVSGVRHGTPLYMAPEILIDGKTSKAADV